MCSNTGYKPALLAWAMLAAFSVAAQELPMETRANNLQYGVSLRLVVDVPFYPDKGSGIMVDDSHLPTLFYKLALTGGVSSNFANTNFHPSLHAEFLLYNGGLGSQRPNYGGGSKHILDFIWGMTMTAGVRNVYRDMDRSDLQYRAVPLYFFSNFAAPPLQNPYDHSVSVGTNLIFTTCENRWNQRVGFLNANLGKVQVSYYNDGGAPIYQSYLGDRRDRYYTGGLVVSYHAKTYNTINLAELTFQKFTGFTNNAFEACNEMDFAFVDYKDRTQNSFNKSCWTLTVSNPEKHYGGYIALYNYDKIDLQHFLHTKGAHAFHVTPSAPFISLGLTTFAKSSTTFAR